MNLNRDVIITCAVTGTGTTISEHVPVTPEEIANSAIEAAKAGAAIVHIHVRDPETGEGSTDVALYEEVSRLIRESDTDVILNLTAGMGGEFVAKKGEENLMDESADMLSVADRVAHVEAIKPEIATLDCGSVNFDTYAYVATLDMLRDMADRITAAGTKIEIEAFDLGHVAQARALMDEGHIPTDSLIQLCMGVPYGAPATTENLLAMKNALPADMKWASFALGRNQMPWVAQAVLNGGHVRVGLEDNLYLERGVYGTNAQLVEKARTIIENLGARVVTCPKEAREMLGLPQRD